MATVTPAAAAQYERIQALQVVAMAAARRAWRRTDARYLRQSWARMVADVVAPTTTATMSAAAIAGAEYGVLDAAQRGEYVTPSAFVNPAGFAASAPSGAPLETVLAAPAVRTLGWIKSGVAEEQALEMGGRVLDGIMRTVVTDTARQAASVDVVARPGMGYVRMLNPPSCGSCVILAGRFYRWNAGFLRHPRCDCIHRPVRSLDAARAEGLVDEPYAYFESLTETEQDRIFGRYRAQAIRDGSDIYRVENSWRGRSKSGLTTSEGTGKVRRGPFRSHSAHLRGRRLTPEGIYAQGLSRADTMALLEQHGYLFPRMVQTPSGWQALRDAQGRPVEGGWALGGGIFGNREGFGQMGRGGTRRGASDAVRQAAARGMRDADDRATMTAAERRVHNARMRYQTVVIENRRPVHEHLGPPTPEMKAQAELGLRRSLMAGSDFLTF